MKLAITLRHLAPLPNDYKDFPYSLFGSDAFELRTYLMKPYSTCNLTREEMIASYRISTEAGVW